MEEKDEHKGKNKDRHKKKKRDHGGAALRGVSRPMAAKELRKQEQALRGKQKEAQKELGIEELPEGFHQILSEEQQKQLQQRHQMQTLWVYWMLIILGIWLVLSPLTFSYGKEVVEPSGGRDVWISLANRSTAMRWSDIISGHLLIIFGWCSLTPGRPVSLWICCGIGVWLNLAPVVFWAPHAVAYVNDTLVGTLVIALSILIPGVPNAIRIKKEGSEVPAGWSYNPSSWPQRSILLVGTFLGWVFSRYLAAFQLGYIDHMWDPFFGDGSRLVLNSDISHSMPVSDGGLGAVAYTLEFLVIWIGGSGRWRTLPWVVIAFAILVIPLGLVHILLILSQPIIVNAWCTWCLLTAALALFLIPLEIDEAAATIQSSIIEKRIGKSWWAAFWASGEPGSNTKDERSPEMIKLPEKPGSMLHAALWGMSFPWTLVATTALGLWLMFAPAVFGFGIEELPADVNRIAGSLIIVVSIISMGEVIRLLRFANILLGLAIAVLPWFLADSDTLLNINASITGLLVAGLSIPRGPKTETYGMFDKWVK